MDKLRRLLGYGCSLTAGTELGDHVVLNCTIDQVDQWKREWGLQRWQQFEQLRDLQAEGRKRSWVAHLAREMNLDYVNRGQSGASLDQCLLRMKNSLHNDTDLVIVGLTYIQRALRFSGSLELITKHQDLETACWNWFRALDAMCEMNVWFVEIADTKASLSFRYCENQDLKQYCESVWSRAKPRLIPINKPKTRIHANSHPYESWHVEIARQMKEFLHEQTTT